MVSRDEEKKGRFRRPDQHLAESPEEDLPSIGHSMYLDVALFELADNKTSVGGQNTQSNNSDDTARRC